MTITGTLRLLGLLAWLAAFAAHSQAAGQIRGAAQTGALRGAVIDPSGAVVPAAAVTLTRRGQTLQTKSAPDGRYVFSNLAPGIYSVEVSAPGFALLAIPRVVIAAGETKALDLPLAIPVQKQELTVESRNRGVGLNSDENASATIVKGSALNALSDNPDELRSELQALAGPAAGPNGGQIYIDGFAGGQLPPKSSILEIRVNQNPFSAEFERIGYGRVDIITKPGSQKLSGSFGAFGTDSVLNTANPLVSQQPDYYFLGFQGNISGPISKRASYFFNVYRMTRQNEDIVDAVNPQNTSANISEAYPNPSTILYIVPRVDLQLGGNTVSVRDSFYRSTADGSDVGGLNLHDQADNIEGDVNTLQISNTFLVNPHFVNETHFQWIRVRNEETPVSFAPTVTVQGAFTSGGNNAGAVQDHNDNFELQNYSTATAGNHTLRFGMILDSYRDANYATSGSNGYYIFSSIATYLADEPSQYSATVVQNPVARAVLFDGGLFFQDDWHWKPNFQLGLGLRYEGQNRIRSHSDFAPRIALAWSPRHAGTAPAKTVVRAGYGWFYDPFTVPNSFGSAGGTPYIVQAIHDNGVNQQSYVATNPKFYDPNAPEPPSVLTSANSLVPTIHTIDPHFQVALDMQGGIGVDRQLAKNVTANVTYLYTQGVHQYMTNNVTAPAFDPASYTITGSAPATYNYQLQSGGFYRQQQLIFTLSTHTKHLAIDGTYTLNQAKSDTQGVTSFPSVAQDPGLDYGRAVFGVRNQLMLVNSYTAPYGIVVASLLEAQSGTPYNLTIGSDLTGNNQFNARPGYGTCGAAGVVSTPYGCLDTDPAGKGERIVPFDLGTGPANAVFHVRISKVIGFGPRIKTAGAGQSYTGESTVSGRGLSSGGAAIRLDAAAPRRYNLTFVAGANNLFNMVNLAPPNGVLISPLFGKSQSLAGGSFANPTPGNRSIIFQALVSF
ncbi:MAG: carboxypeptidase regulatory-like domain-containing protein [Terracidiphilus sp.]